LIFYNNKSFDQWWRYTTASQGKKAFGLVVALPKLSSSKKFQCDNMMLIKYTIRGFEMN